MLIRRKPANRVLYTKRKPGSQKLFSVGSLIKHLRYDYLYSSIFLLYVVVKNKRPLRKIQKLYVQMYEMKLNSQNSWM